MSNLDYFNIIHIFTYSLPGIEYGHEFYKLFPYFLYPVPNIAMSGTIYMTVSISLERYLSLCHLELKNRKIWHYLIPVILLAIAVNIPKFLEYQTKFYQDPTNNNISVPYIDHTERKLSAFHIESYEMWTELFLSAVIPFTMLLTLNIIIGLKLKKMATELKR